MLSKRGGGFKIAMNALNIGRIKLAAACLDAERRVTTASIQYANEREQFKTKIIDFGAVKEKIAKMAMDTYVGESATYRAGKNIEDRIAALKSEGKSHQEGGENINVEGGEAIIPKKNVEKYTPEFINRIISHQFKF